MILKKTEDAKDTPALPRAIARGVAYSTLGNVFLRVFDVLTIIILLRALSIYDYGIYVLALASYSFWTALFLPGLQNVIVADASAVRRDNRAQVRALFSVYAYFLIAVCIVLWAGFFFAGSNFAHVVDGKTKYLSVISWLFLLSPFETLLGVKIAILLDFGWGFIYKLLKSALRLGILVILLLFFSIGIWGALMSLVISMALALLIMWTFYKRERWFTSVTLASVRDFWQRALRTHGKWALAEDFFNSTTQNIQPFIIKFILGAEAVALVALASNMISFAKTSLPVRDVLFPTLPQTENRQQFTLYVGKLMKYATLAYTAITLVSAVGAPIAVHLLFPKYIPALMVFYIALVSLPVFGIRSVAVPVFFALKAQRALFFIIVTRTLLSLVLFVGLAWAFGLPGVAVVMALTSIVTAVSYLFEIRRRLPGMRFSMRGLFVYDAYDREIVGAVLRYVRRKLVPPAFQ